MIIKSTIIIKSQRKIVTIYSLYKNKGERKKSKAHQANQNANDDIFDAEDKNDISFIDELNDLLGMEDIRVKKNKMLCYEESIIENRANFEKDILNNCENSYIVENSYLEISKQKVCDDESLTCNPQKDYLGENFCFGADQIENKEEVSFL